MLLVLLSPQFFALPHISVQANTDLRRHAVNGAHRGGRVVGLDQLFNQNPRLQIGLQGLQHLGYAFI